VSAILTHCELLGVVLIHELLDAILIPELPVTELTHKLLSTVSTVLTRCELPEVVLIHELPGAILIRKFPNTVSEILI